MFVRYISHEVRTPLNTVIMGLQVLYDELTKHKELGILDIVNDIRISSDIALNTLNEFLMIDKLGEGTLLIEKTYFPVNELIDECIQQFQVQVSNPIY